jgi:hypothetical protein
MPQNTSRPLDSKHRIYVAGTAETQIVIPDRARARNDPESICRYDSKMDSRLRGNDERNVGCVSRASGVTHRQGP